ncbi:unnamed protein product [Darwinula stevensoni]|uniref:GDP-fucose pyrophosphorylase domain-containing protein n=1 Tax=Darwinula stevensoni TaxID=69355 RepID=A0A7R9A3T4_9CRUS|nr:unnamed protein product [Darwinula stevensoni]CAG0881979.1 unnamed protein product [Darwinula stevensoni]
MSVRDVKQKEATVGLLSRNKDLLLQHCRIHVYEDPPGPRKGGLSTRLPSQLGVGKLFMPMPVAGKTPVLLLNLKLKSLSQVVDVLSPGILITACDDLETFSIEKHDLQLLPEYPSGFVALGHLSPPSIGEGHGEQEYVCTDSVYWFDHTVTRALLPLCPAMKTLTTELQIYGDFLECLGTREDKLYLKSLFDPVRDAELGAEIPEGVLLHTFAVSAGFVTVACHRKDNMKLEVPYEERHSLTFLNKSIAYAEQILTYIAN